MVIDLVDSENRPIGTVRRGDVFKVAGGFRTVHVLVFNSEGQLLVQQQAKSRPRAPLTWGSSVAAYLFAGESYLEAAKRRVNQELGIKRPSADFVDVVRVDDLGHDKFIGVVTCVSDGPFDIDESQINQLKFLPVSEVKESIENGDVAFAPAFPAVLDAYLSHRGPN